MCKQMLLQVGYIALTGAAKVALQVSFETFIEDTPLSQIEFILAEIVLGQVVQVHVQMLYKLVEFDEIGRVKRVPVLLVFEAIRLKISAHNVHV